MSAVIHVKVSFEGVLDTDTHVEHGSPVAERLTNGLCAGWHLLNLTAEQVFC